MTTLKENTALPYAFDLLYGIKSLHQLEEEVSYLRDRLNSIYDTCREYEIPLDNDDDHQK